MAEGEGLRVYLILERELLLKQVSNFILLSVMIVLRSYLIIIHKLLRREVSYI